MMNLGRTVMTCGINALIENNTISKKDLMDIIIRHSNNDYGELGEADTLLQQENLKNNIQDRVISVYTINGVKLWIITEWDRSVTTILLPDEY